MTRTSNTVEQCFVDGVMFMSGAGCFRLDVKLAFKEGLLHKQQGPE